MGPAAAGRPRWIAGGDRGRSGSGSHHRQGSGGTEPMPGLRGPGGGDGDGRERKIERVLNHMCPDTRSPTERPVKKSIDEW